MWLSNKLDCDLASLINHNIISKEAFSTKISSILKNNKFEYKLKFIDDDKICKISSAKIISEYLNLDMSLNTEHKFKINSVFKIPKKNTLSLDVSAHAPTDKLSNCYVDHVSVNLLNSCYSSQLKYHLTKHYYSCSLCFIKKQNNFTVKLGCDNQFNTSRQWMNNVLGLAITRYATNGSTTISVNSKPFESLDNQEFCMGISTNFQNKSILAVKFDNLNNKKRQKITAGFLLNFQDDFSVKAKVDHNGSLSTTFMKKFPSGNEILLNSGINLTAKSFDKLQFSYGIELNMKV